MAARIYADGNFVVYDLDDTDGVTIDFAKAAGSFTESNGVFWIQQNDEHLQQRVAISDATAFYNASTGTNPYTTDSFRTFLRENFSAGAGGSAPLAEANQVQSESTRTYQVGSDYLSFRNSADTFDALKIDGDGDIHAGVSGKSFYLGGGSGRLQFASSGYSFAVGLDFYNCRLSNLFNANSQDINNLRRLFYGGTYDTNGTNMAAFTVGTAPTAVQLSQYKQYAADWNGANTSTPHFLNEEGDTLILAKVVDAALANSPNSGDANTDALITALKSVLTTLGLGASS